MAKPTSTEAKSGPPNNRFSPFSPKTGQVEQKPTPNGRVSPQSNLCAVRHAAAFVRGNDIEQVDTRLLRTPIHVGVAVPMAYIDCVFIDRENELRQSKPPNPQSLQRPPVDPWTRSRLTRQFAPPK
ncbi:hypothetical protein LguiA_003870 [Lonicera macranthoides]